MASKEIEIVVPWGIVAAKTWGPSSYPVVLLFHGLLDNAGTFDYLVPILPSSYYYVCVDLPGHGKSSHLPDGLTLQGMDYIYVVKVLADHFNQDKYIIIGHSFGAILGMQFGLVYPEKLDKVFILDTIWFEIVKPKDFSSWTRKKFDEFTKINNQVRRNMDMKVSYKQAQEIISTWRYTNCELTPRSLEALLQRSIVECGGGKYKFTRDLRMRNYMCYPVDERYASEILKLTDITFKVVTIVTKYCDNYYNEAYPNLVAEFKNIGEWFVVDGNHHIHLNNPEVVAPIINSFLDEDSFPV